MPALTDSIPSVPIPASYLRGRTCSYDSLWQAAADSNRIMGNNPLNTAFFIQSQQLAADSLTEQTEVSAASMYGKHATLCTTLNSSHTVGVGIARKQPLGGVMSYLPYTAVLLLALLLVYYTRNYLRTLFISLINFKLAHKLYKSNMQNTNRALHVLTWFSLIPASIFVGYILHRFPSQLVTIPNTQVYLIAALGFATLYTFKNIILYGAGVLTFSKGMIQELRYHSRLFIGLWGVLAFPAVLLLNLNADNGNTLMLFIIATGLCLLFFVLYLIRTLQLFLSEKVSLFFWFLYLCTLELLPAILVFDYLFPIR